MATSSRWTRGISETIAGLGGRLASVIGLLAVVAIAALVTQLAPPPDPARADDAADDLPARVVAAPDWTADIRDAPLSRALVAFESYTGSESSLTLVGPGDSYRTFDPSGSGGEWDGFVALSPDGRYLMTGHDQRAQVLDVATGETRMLNAGRPLALSADGKLAVLAHFDGDQDTYPVTGEIRVVDTASGDVRWTVPLDPGPLSPTVNATLSPDGSTMLVHRHGDLYAYRPDRGVVWKRSTELGDGVGRAVWKPDGRTVAGADFCTLAADSGEQGECVDPFRLERRAGMENFGPHHLLGWHGDGLVVYSARDVVDLSGTPKILLRAPRDVRQLVVATGRVRWQARQPGPPDLGPAIARYERPIRIGGLTAIAIVAVVLAIRLRRRTPGQPLAD